MEKNWYANGLDAQEGQIYSWTQTPSEVTMTLVLDPPAGAKEMDVQLTPTHLKVRRRNQPPGEYLIDGAFSKAHRMDDSNWWIDDRKVLTVQLVKIKRSEWWMSLLVGGKELTWDQIQPEHPTYAEDLDGETQALVKKMMFDNQQRQRGLPTSEDLEKQRLLDQFKSQHPDLDFSALMNQANAQQAPGETHQEDGAESSPIDLS